jgi:hypothetical protein
MTAALDASELLRRFEEMAATCKSARAGHKPSLGFGSDQRVASWRRSNIAASFAAASAESVN